MLTVDGESSYTVDLYDDSGYAQSEVALWTSPVLPYGEHNVTISQIGIDARFGYFPYLFTETWIATVPINVAAYTATEAKSTPTSIPIPTRSPSSSSTNIAPIVGGVVGGVIALILLTFLFFLWRRDKRNRARGGAQKVKKAEGKMTIEDDLPMRNAGSGGGTGNANGIVNGAYSGANTGGNGGGPGEGGGWGNGGYATYSNDGRQARSSYSPGNGNDEGRGVSYGSHQPMLGSTNSGDGSTYASQQTHQQQPQFYSQSQPANSQSPYQSPSPSQSQSQQQYPQYQQQYPDPSSPTSPTFRSYDGSMRQNYDPVTNPNEVNEGRTANGAYPYHTQGSGDDRRRYPVPEI